MPNTNKARNQFDEAVEKARHQFDEAVENDRLKEYLAQHPDFKATCGNCYRKSTMNLQVLCDHTGTDDTAACDDWIPGPMTKEELSALLGFEYDGDIPRLDHVQENPTMSFYRCNGCGNTCTANLKESPSVTDIFCPLTGMMNAPFKKVDPADEDSFLSQQREDLTLDPQIAEPLEVNRTYYTSYVANVKNLPPDVVPVVFDYLYDDAGIRYRNLAPTFASYHWWKHVHHDNNIYANEYKQLILDRRNPLLVRDELLTMTNGKTFCLVSEEKPGEFSLRHIVADWMRKAGIDIQEYQNTSTTH